ncbi:cytidine deaminase-like protein [Obelidium mucronatum]|nr:cytidine deaminase-like protein [Obelidium mucronatum]
MLLLLVGPRNSGKHAIAEYFAAQHGFAHLRVACASDAGDARDANDACPAFADAKLALAHATAHWDAGFVVADVVALAQARGFALADWLKRPFVLLVAVTAGAAVRFARGGRRGDKSLDAWLAADDADMHGRSSRLMNKAAVTINNSFASLDELYALLESPQVNLTNPNRLRPDWDHYFMTLCDLAAQRSNCMKRRVGCVVTKDTRVIATGYNGTPKGLRNCNEGGCKRCNDATSRMGDGLELCICLHAEENALLEAGRDRISNGGRAILYCNTCPCIQCARKIIQVGISEVVYSLSYGMDTTTLRLFSEAGIVLRQLDHLESCF